MCVSHTYIPPPPLQPPPPPPPFLSYPFMDTFLIFITVVTNVMNMVRHYIFKKTTSFPLKIYPEVGLLDHRIVLFLILWETFTLFSIIAAQIYIFSNNTVCKGSLFSKPSLTFGVPCFNHLDRYEVISYWLLFVFSWWSVMSNTFSYVLVIFMSSLKMSVQIFPFLNKIIKMFLLCFGDGVVWVLNIFLILTPNG